jgi:hypothetical protein
MTLKSIAIEDMGDGTAKEEMIATFKRAGFVERTCLCGRWYMRHKDDADVYCPPCASKLPPHLNN